MAADGDDGGDKWQRALRKKLRQVLQLKHRCEAEGLTPDAAQAGKLASEADLRAELAALGCDLGEVEADAVAAAAAAAAAPAKKKVKKPKPEEAAPTARQAGGGAGQRGGGGGARDAELRAAISRAHSIPGALQAAAAPGVADVSADVRAHALFRVAKLAESQPGDAGWARGDAWRELLRCLTADGTDGALGGLQVSKALWAAARLSGHLRGGGDGGGDGGSGSGFGALLGALQSAAAAAAPALDCQGCSNAWWALATVQAGGHPGGAPTNDRALHALERRAKALLPEFNSQDFGNFVWAVAKLRWQLQELEPEALTAAFAALVPRCKWRELSMALWGLATLGLPPPAAALRTMAARLAGAEMELGPQGLPNVLWALARFDSPDAPREMLEGLQPGRGQRRLGDRSPGRRPPAADALRALLAPPAVLRRMGAQDVGDVLWAVARVGGIGKEGGRALAERAAEVVGDMSWQALGHLEYALPALRPKRQAAEALRGALGAAVARRVEEVNGRAGGLDDAAAAALAAAEAVGRVLEGCAQVLVVGQPKGSALAKAAQAACGPGASLKYWCRFACGKTPGRVRPAASSQAFDGAVVRVPASRGLFAAAVAELAALLPEGAEAVFVGHRSEGRGARGVEASVEPYFQVRRRPASAEAGGQGGFLVVARRTKAKAAPQSHTERTTLRLGPAETGGAEGAELPWHVAPGLFAGGGLDIMTAFLLRHMPTPPKKARVLDFCCGSGAIGAALLQRQPSLRLHALDADTVAVEAARANLPEGAQLLCSDGWRGLQADDAPKDAKGKARRFDWIVSNPPVHRGQRDDFRVVAALLDGGWARLRAGGRLWVVAQSYIPLVTMAQASAAAHAGGDRITVEVAARDGRFTVLLCTKASKDGAAAGNAAPDAGRPIKRGRPSDAAGNGSTKRSSRKIEA
eukprot:jgi/Tetstr1/449145/TSEL_036355.t1